MWPYQQWAIQSVIVRLQVPTAARMKMTAFWAHCLHHQGDDETSVYVNKPTRRYIPEGRHLQSVRASPWSSLRASEPVSRSASEGVWHNSSQSLLRWGATSRSGKPERASYELRYCTRGSDSTGFTCYFHRGTKSRWFIFVYSGCHRMEPAAIFFFYLTTKRKEIGTCFYTWCI
jgi:hypothetical protein